MEDKDEILLKDFFRENRQEIADDGFSRRVMNRLPERRIWIVSQLLTALTVVLSMGVFIYFGGVNLLGGTLREVFQNFTLGGSLDTFSGTEPWTIGVVALVLLYMGYGKLANLPE